MVLTATLAGALALSGCSRAKSTPSLPDSVCWGAFGGVSVEPLLPDGEEASVRVSDAEFGLFGGQASAYCRVYVHGKEGFLAWAQARSSGKGTDWNHWGGRAATTIAAGDEGFLWATGASSVILCERPGQPRATTLSDAQKYLELAVVAEQAPPDEKSRTAFTNLIRQYVQFATRELKCANK
ncbi:hypothetical protein [Streptomyces sp. NPDC056670]|uniref:hypothetical protein n=1 Tax=Streptomyces sp. NPDC056670 TaxID=3345904 RepID=UPI0036C4FEED